MPTEYVRSKDWEHKIRGSQIILKTCQSCHDANWHFYMHKETGAWDCKKCGEKGSLFSLKKSLGDIEDAIHPAARKLDWKRPDAKVVTSYHTAIFSDYDTLQYLNKRGISNETIKRFRLGVKTKGDQRWLSIPITDAKGIANVKYRLLPPGEKTFEREQGCRSILFNGQAIPNHDSIIITEGELDAITLLQYGFENAVGTTNGAQSFDATWIDQLSKTKTVYLCYDSDTAGQKGAVELAKRLGYGRCRNILLPTKDANDFFLRHTKEEFSRLMDSSRAFELPGVITVEQSLDLLQGELERENTQDQGIKTRWDNVNRIICGWKPGDLVVVTALPKTGKTTFLLDVTRDLVLDQVPCLFFCMEMRPERLIRKFIQAQYFIENPTIKHVQYARGLLQNSPLYFGHNFKFQKLEDLFGIIREAIMRYGLKFVVFDNLHMLCRTDRVNEQLAQAVLGFKLLAEETEIPICVIAQPRKREGGGSEVMTAEDVKYSSAIHSDCDQMIVLHRNRRVSKAKEISSDMATKDESMDPITLVRVEAHRYGPGGETVLYYNGAQSRFEQLETKQTMSVVGKDRAQGR